MIKKVNIKNFGLFSDFQWNFTRSGKKGEVNDIFFEKEKLNTMEIVLWICKNMKLKREQLGIAGLKDKEGITKQRISISKKKLKIY